MGVHYFTLYTLNTFDKVRNNRANKKVCLDASLSPTRQHRLSGALFPTSPQRTQHRSLQRSPHYTTCIVHGLGQDSGSLTRTPDSGCRDHARRGAFLLTALFPSFSLCPQGSALTIARPPLSSPWETSSVPPLYLKSSCAHNPQILISSPDFPPMADSCASPLQPLATAQSLGAGTSEGHFSAHIFWDFLAVLDIVGTPSFGLHDPASSFFLATPHSLQDVSSESAES